MDRAGTKAEDRKFTEIFEIFQKFYDTGKIKCEEFISERGNKKIS
jgi:hypothetical protein